MEMFLLNNEHSFVKDIGLAQTGLAGQNVPSMLLLKQESYFTGESSGDTKIAAVDFKITKGDSFGAGERGNLSMIAQCQEASIDSEIEKNSSCKPIMGQGILGSKAQNSMDFDNPFCNLSKYLNQKNQMEDIQEEIQEFAEEAEIIQRSKIADEQDKFLDDSFGTNLEFSRLIQNTGQFEQIIEDK